MKGFDDHLDNYGDPGDGYYGEAGTRNPEEPASAAYLPAVQGDGTGFGKVWGVEEFDDDPAELEAYDKAELAVINGEYPDTEAYFASRCNHVSQDDTIGACDRYNYESQISGLTNDGMAVMTPDYSMINQASMWGPTRLDPFPPGVAKQDILAILAYNWRDEEVDYYDTLGSQDISAEELNKTHIFAAMNRVNDWITVTRHG